MSYYYHHCSPPHPSTFLSSLQPYHYRVLWGLHHGIITFHLPDEETEPQKGAVILSKAYRGEATPISRQRLCLSCLSPNMAPSLTRVLSSGLSV